MTTQRPTFEELARAFYEVDPLRLACKENELLDEYHPEAAWVVDEIGTGLPILDAITNALVYFFDLDADRAYRHAVEVDAQLYANRMQGPEQGFPSDR